MIPVKFRKDKKKVSVIGKVIIAGACLLASGNSFAQAGFDFGVKGNIQSSTLINLKDQAAGPELDFVNKVRLAGGISGGYNFNKHVGVEVNVLYSRQGQDYKGDISQISSANKGIFSSNIQLLANANNIPLVDHYTASVALTYVKVPILFRFTGKNTKKVFFSSFIGPQMDMLTSVKYQVNGKNAPVSTLKMSAEDGYKKSGVDGVLGVGAGFNLSKCLVLSVHLHLEYGLMDAENKSAKYTLDNSTADFYNSKRFTTNNATGGFLVSLNYKLQKKQKAAMETSDQSNTTETSEKTKTKTKTKTKSDDADDADDSNTEDKTQDKTKK